jgi:hypothetical protein
MGTDPKGPGAELHALLIGSSNRGGGGGAAHGSDGGWVGGGGHPSPLTGGGGVGAAGGASDSAAAAEYERLLLSGQRGAALAVATGAGLWAHAMLLARHIGEQHFAVTAAAMARAACTPGSPLHTLELMLAGLTEGGLEDTTPFSPRYCCVSKHVRLMTARYHFSPR